MFPTLNCSPPRADRFLTTCNHRMAAAGGGTQNGMVPESLKTQLAIAIRSIRWSYAIFWSISQSDEGVLEWREGYYNGDIKTRKTIQVSNFDDADQLGLLRSEQLKELYESLSDGESKRPSASLSPEDLTDTEWYYLVCMSFQFNIGEGLPGCTFANGKSIWLSDAPYADSKIFNRSLLAKSASIQTVVCFPYLEGVIEMGVTELIEEDPCLIEHVKASYLTNPSVSFPMIRMSVSENVGRNEMDSRVFDELIDPEVNVTDQECDHQVMDDSFLVDDLHEGANQQMQSWPLMDEEFSNCIMQNATSSSDCISHTILNSGSLMDEQEKGNHTRKRNGCCIIDLDQTADNNGVVGSLLRSSRPFLLNTRLMKLEIQESSFVGWRKNSHFQPKIGTPQRLLKKILLDVPRMHGGGWFDSRKKEVLHVDVDSSHTLSERRRRERISDRFSILGSLVPCGKVDKVSILDNTIGYVKELERRVEELESCSSGLNARTKRKIAENSNSEGMISNKIGKNPNSTNKRKANELSIGSTDNVKVTINENDLIIEIRCLWRESLLLDVINAMGRLCLDSHSVHLSNVDGFLSITIKSKFEGSRAGSVGMITEAIQRVLWKN